MGWRQEWSRRQERDWADSLGKARRHGDQEEGKQESVEWAGIAKSPRAERRAKWAEDFQ